MPPPLLSMRMIKTLFHQILFLRQSQRQCAQALGISKGVVGKYAIAAKAAGLSWADIEPLDEAALERRPFGHLGQVDQILSLQLAAEQGKLAAGDLAVLVAAGVGYVWNALALRWRGEGEATGQDGAAA